MNILNFALGGLLGAESGSPFASLTSPVGSLVSALGGGNTAAAAASPVPSRDALVSDLPGIASSVNSLAQAAGSLGGGDSSALDGLALPQLPPMPAPQKAPAGATDDHGVSNVVFSDAAADGALIH